MIDLRQPHRALFSTPFYQTERKTQTMTITERTPTLSIKTQRGILMCRPDFFGIEYEINPWMHIQNPADRARALSEWDELYATYQRCGVNVELVEPVRGLPDLVFTANAGLVWGKSLILSRFFHPERQREEPYFGAWFQEHGYEVVTVANPFEGEGDALFHDGKLIMGYGFRSSRAAHAEVERLIDLPIVPLELRDGRYYHLDTCFCAIDDQTVMYYPPAFSAEGRATIESLAPNVIAVTDDEAADFACNALPWGDKLICSTDSPRLAAELRKVGYEMISLDTVEFRKSGGSVKCLSLYL